MVGREGLGRHVAFVYLASIYLSSQCTIAINSNATPHLSNACSLASSRRMSWSTTMRSADPVARM